MPKSIVPILVNILQYKVWLWDQNWGCSIPICVLGLKTLKLSIFEKYWLAAKVWRIRSKTIVDHYGLGSMA